MSRNLPTNTANAIASAHVGEEIMFAKLEFPDGTLYLHTSLGTYTWGGQDWSGVGSWGGIEGIEEAQQISAYSATLTLSGLDSTLLNEALSQDYFMRPVTIYFGVANENDVLVDTPTQIWAGFCDSLQLSVGADGGDVIRLVCESELVQFERSANLRYSDNAQQNVHSGDTFFQFLPSIADNPAIKWANADSENLVGKGVVRDPTDIPSLPQGFLTLANGRKQKTLKAFNNWEKRAFVYGDSDCCQFASHVIKEITGIDYMKSFDYSSEVEAKDIIKKQGGFVSAVTEFLGQPCPKEVLQDGDPVMIEINPMGQLMGVLFGKHVVCLAERKMIRINSRHITHGWAI